METATPVTIRAEGTHDESNYDLPQTLFGAISMLFTCLSLAFAIWKFRGKFRRQWYRRLERQNPFELEAQLPEVCVAKKKMSTIQWLTESSTVVQA